MAIEKTPLDPNGTDWAPCPTGTLRALTKPPSAGIASRRRFLSGVATGAAVGGLGLGALAFHQRTQPPGNLTCPQLAKFVPAYAANQLDRSMAYRVELHLAKCPKCREQFEHYHA